MSTHQRRSVHFSDTLEAISEVDENVSEEEPVERNEQTVSPNRSAWSPSETSRFSQNQFPEERIDTAPRQPRRSLDSILDEAIQSCEGLLAVSPSDEERISRISQALPQLPSRKIRLDRSLFSIGSDSSFPPPPPLSTSCIVSHVLDEILKK